MKLHLLAFAGSLLCSFAVAQDSYWIANRGSSDIMRVSSWGSVLERVATPTTLRSCTTAPDGKVWIVRFIQPTFDIYDPASGTLTSIPSPGGSPYQIAFDAGGHAWISNGGTSVHEFDAGGNFVQTVALTVGSALGITVDADGNKWVAHRVSPASVSRIDPAGVPTNFPIVGTATMLPVTIMADYRGLFTSSRIWVVGDSSSDLAELDVNGTTIGVYPQPATSIGSLAFDANGDIWVGSYGSGALLQVDAATGNNLNTYSIPPSINGMTVDHYGRLLVTARLATPPCELRRIDPATGTVEIPAKLTFGGFNASLTQSAASTAWQYSWVVDPFGDLDGDGEVNWSEVTAGTSPVDAASTSSFRVESFGVTMNGSTPTFEVASPAAQLWLVAYSVALITPSPIPGFGGLLGIDPAGVVLTAAGLGSASLPFAIPTNPAFAGVEFYSQGVTFDGVGFNFQNISGMRIW